MKKLFALLLTLCTLLALAGCGQKDTNNSSKPPAESSAAVQQNSESNKLAAGKTLVVYFSATGNTETVARQIANLTQGDLFKIEPAAPYTEQDLDYNNQNSRVYLEHADPAKQAVALKTNTPQGWAEYSTVYVGYPIWWGSAAWPATSFVKANNFTGKTVIPFCTSASSGLGSSAAELSKAATGGTWQAGKRFGSSPDESTVQEFVTNNKE